jgi:hypothetical protein
MSSDHTPGPWNIEVSDTHTTVESKYQTIATNVSNCDADVIAAGPEMLQALKDLVFQFENAWEKNGISCSDIDRARFAIRKAEGK